MTEAERLRAEFDRSFSRPSAELAGAFDTYLLVEAGAATFALLSAEVRGIEPTANVVPLPSALPALLGVVGIRGRVLPVFSLAGLTGGVVQDDHVGSLVLVQCSGRSAAVRTDARTGEAALSVSRVVHFLRQPRADGAVPVSFLEYLSGRYEVVSVAGLLPQAEEDNAHSQLFKEP